MVTRGFRKCGIFVAIYDSEDDDINIEGLENYKIDSVDKHPFDSEDSMRVIQLLQQILKAH